MIGREERRLRRVFRRILIVTAALPLIPAGIEACGGSSTTDGPGDAATTDATIGDGNGDDGDAGLEPSEAAVNDALTGPCAPRPIDASDLRDSGDADAADADHCASLVRLECGLPASIVPRENCIIGLSDCYQLCDGLFFYCHAADDSCVDGSIVSGPITIDCVTCLGAVGRRPKGLVAASRSGARSALGGYFARASHLEAASVHAFHALERELAALGAPGALIDSAARAARDEVRHASVTRRLARRFGGTPERARIAPTKTKTIAASKRAPAAAQRRTLERAAIENAVEGCVRETYGALVAVWQAAHAADPEIAAAMRAIAADETRHAALSWAIERWAQARLDAPARTRLAARRAAAIAEIEREVSSIPDSVARAAGFPSIAAQTRLLGALKEALWTT